MANKRIVITGMGAITPISDTLDDYYTNLIKGKSGITKFHSIDTSQIECKIGGDLGGYDYKTKMLSLKEKMPEDSFKRMKKIMKTAPFATKISLLTAVEAWIDSGLFNQKIDPRQVCAILGGHNYHNKYIEENTLQFLEEPEYISAFMGVSMFDVDTIACIAETIKIMGPMYTVGGTCASTGIAMKNTIYEMFYNDYPVAIVGGGVIDYSRVGFQAFVMIDAVCYKSFNETPEIASRPFDAAREGLVPSHGAGMLVLEELEHAIARGANIYAEVLAVESNCDGSHLSAPSITGQTYVINKALERAKINPEQITYVNAHATSTPLGDIIEIKSLKEVFKEHAYNLKINATKSIIGHTGWTAHSLELIASILQMKNSHLHPSINIDNLDPEIDLDICANKSQAYEFDYFLNNSFGFGGINCCSIIGKYRK